MKIRSWKFKNLQFIKLFANCDFSVAESMINERIVNGEFNQIAQQAKNL